MYATPKLQKWKIYLISNVNHNYRLLPMLDLMLLPTLDLMLLPMLDLMLLPTLDLMLLDNGQFKK